MKKQMKKFKRYENGGEVMGEMDPREAAAKQRGLDISNKEAPVGFFERIKAGNIDQPGSEAYNRFGAGRGYAQNMDDENEAMRAANRAPSAPAVPAVPASSARPLTDPMYADYGSNTSSSETIKPTRQVITKPTLPTRPNAPGKQLERLDLPKAPQYAGPLRGMRSDAGKSPPVVTHGFPIYGEGSAASKIPGQSAKAPKGEKIDSSESSRNVGNALMATGALGLGAAGAYKAKKMYDAAKKLKKSMSGTKKTERPGKDFMEGLTVSDMTAKKRGGAVKKYASGGMVSSASRRADGIATKGKTRGKIC